MKKSQKGTTKKRGLSKAPAKKASTSKDKKTAPKKKVPAAPTQTTKNIPLKKKTTKTDQNSDPAAPSISRSNSLKKPVKNGFSRQST